MEASAWNDGGTTYGIRVGVSNRNAYFDRCWTEVEIEIDGKWHPLPLTAGFWSKCPELRSRVIREWLQRHNSLNWPRGKPPKFQLIPLGGNRFRIENHHMGDTRCQSEG